MCTCPRLIKFICAITICSSFGRVSSDSHLSDRAKIAFRTIGRPFRWPLCSTVRVHKGIILCMHPANDRWRYTVTLSLIGWGHTQNDQCAYRIVCIFQGINCTSSYHLSEPEFYKEPAISHVYSYMMMSCSGSAAWLAASGGLVCNNPGSVASTMADNKLSISTHLSQPGE